MDDAELVMDRLSWSDEDEVICVVVSERPEHNFSFTRKAINELYIQPKWRLTLDFVMLHGAVTEKECRVSVRPFKFGGRTLENVEQLRDFLFQVRDDVQPIDEQIDELETQIRTLKQRKSELEKQKDQRYRELLATKEER